MHQIVARPDRPLPPDPLAVRLDGAIEETYRRHGWQNHELDRLLTLRLALARRRWLSDDTGDDLPSGEPDAAGHSQDAPRGDALPRLGGCA